MVKNNNRTMTKYLIAFFLTIAAFASARAQAPYVNSINPTSASTGDVVNIVGSNFTGATVVYFGGARSSSITVVNDNLVTAEVPFGANFDQISVLHTTNGAGYSSQKFIPGFAGQAVSDGSTLSGNVSGQEVFATSKTQTQDLCTCDFENDGDLDVAVSNVGSTDISIFTNISTVGDANFTSAVISNTFPVTNVICGDLDGDGFADLIANELGGEGKIYTYRNNQAGGFEAREEVTIPQNGSLFRKPGRIALGDLDLDGKPEVVVTAEDDNSIFFFENNSTNGNIILAATPESLTSTESSGTAGLGGLDIADLNNDGFPEIITSNFTEPGFYIFQNNSQPNTFSFRSPLFTNTNSNIRALQAGDLDQDGFMDIVLTNSDISSSDIIEIAENTTTTAGQDITMSTPIQILGINTSWGLDLGDIDGDGDLDIAVATFGANNGFYVVMNTNAATIASTSYSVGLIAQSNANNSRNIKLTDIDADGRPDFVYTNNSTAEGTGNLATRLNEICFVPVITPSGSTALCAGDVIDLVAPKTGYSYVWRKDNVVDAGQTTNTWPNVSAAGSYTVTISDNAGCQTESSALVVTAPGGTYNAATISASDATPCDGDNITLNVDTEDPSSSYMWTGPNGYTSTTKEPTISGITVEHSGDYYLTTTSSGAGGCQKTSAALSISVTGLPAITVNNSKADFFCNGETINLSTNEFAGHTYDWKLNGASFAPAQTDPAVLAATAAGDYSVTITISGCSFTSSARTLTTVAPPTSSFSASDATICEGVAIDFTATSTGDAALTIVNNWDYKDGSAVETGSPVSHAFSTAGDYDVAVTAKYDGIADEDCTYTPASSTVTIVAPPSGTDLDLIISDNTDPMNYEKCKDVGLTLRVEAIYPNYEWKTGTTTFSTISIANVVEEQSVFVTLTNDVQCVFDSNPVSVTNFTTGGIQISASSPNTVELDATLGKIVNLQEDQTNVTLSVSNTEAPAWEPALYINDTTLTTVEVTISSRQLISVYGIDALGCQEKDTVTLVIPGIQGAKSFTPNGDGINDCWEVSNVGTTDCQVVIFDSKGRRIREISFNGDGSADDCVWDGNKSNGSSLPDGMYYYFVSCSDSGNESSGSIFMAR